MSKLSFADVLVGLEIILTTNPIMIHYVMNSVCILIFMYACLYMNTCTYPSLDGLNSTWLLIVHELNWWSLWRLQVSKYHNLLYEYT